MESRSHGNPEWTTVLLAVAVFFAIATSWVPGILCESTLFRELRQSSVSQSDLRKAIERATAHDPTMTDADRKIRLENVNLLLSLPVLQEGPNDSVIKYGYSTLFEHVGLRRAWFSLLAVLLSVSTAVAFFLIVRKPCENDRRSVRFLLLALAIFVIGGILPYLFSGKKAGNLAIVGFYAALFTWVYGLQVCDLKETFGLQVTTEISASRLNAIYTYHMRLLTFAFAIFGVVTITLMFQVSGTIGEMYPLSTSLKHHLLFWLIWHDFYGSMILFVGVVGRLVETLTEVIRLYPSPRSAISKNGGNLSRVG